MKSYLNLLIANLKMTIRNRQSLFWMFVFPVLMMGLLGIVFGNAGREDAKITIVRVDKSVTAANISDAFKRIKAFKVREATKEKALDDLENGRTDAVLVLDKGFADGLERQRMIKIATPLPPGVGKPQGIVFAAPQPGKVKLYYDPAATFTSQAVRSAVTSILGGIDRNLSGAPTLLTVESHSVRSRGLRYIDFLVPGIIAMTLMNSALFGLSGTVVNYRERGILRRLKVTPQPLSGFIAAQISNQLIFALIRAGLLVAVGHFIFQVAIVGNLLSLVVVVIIGSLAFTTLAFSIASFAPTRETADTLSNIISMPMMFLGGVFFPVDAAPRWIQPVVKVLPLRYLGNAMRDIMIRGSSLMDVRSDLYVLLGVTAVFFAVSVRFWRWE